MDKIAIKRRRRRDWELGTWEVGLDRHWRCFVWVLYWCAKQNKAIANNKILIISSNRRTTTTTMR